MEKKTELKPCPFCGTDVQRVIGFMGVNFSSVLNAVQRLVLTTNITTITKTKR